jgi:aspartate/methionine/tyrosine aminotransferase
LRRAIAGHYGARYDLDIDPGRVIVTTGGSAALQLALAAVLEVGDGVMVTEPGYPCHRHIAAVTGALVHVLALRAATGWRPSREQLEQQWRPGTRALMLTTPGNPTGAVLGSAELAAISAAAHARGAALIVDETYQGLVYDADDVTALACGDDGLFVVNSFSKYFGLTGWRLGWLVVPSGWAPIVERLAQNLYLAPPTLSQHVALAALEPPVLALLEDRRAKFRQRRDLLLEALPTLGMTMPSTPQGAFYAFAGLPPGHDDAAAFAAALLDAAGVAVTPGADFGGADGARMLRFAYTETLPRLRLGVERLRRFVGAS